MADNTATNPALDTDPTTQGYTPVKPYNDAVEKILNANVETTSYVLIILAAVIAIGMTEPTIEINDNANISASMTQISSDLNTISSELTKLQSAIVPSSSANSSNTFTYNGTTIDINPNIFTKNDFNSLCNAFTDLYSANAANGNISNYFITINGTDYYPNKNGTWTGVPTGDAPPASAGTGPASDIQVYMFYTASLQVDMDTYYGRSVNTTKVFPTSQTQITDPNLKALNKLYNDFNTGYSNNSAYNPSNPPSFDQPSMAGIMIYYSSNGYTFPPGMNYEGIMVHQMGALADNYNSCLSSGQTSYLATMSQDTNGATTQLNTVSQTMMNQVGQDTQEIQSLDGIGQTIIKEANQATLNMINNGRVQ